MKIYISFKTTHYQYEGMTPGISGAKEKIVKEKKTKKQKTKVS